MTDPTRLDSCAAVAMNELSQSAALRRRPARGRGRGRGQEERIFGRCLSVSDVSVCGELGDARKQVAPHEESETKTVTVTFLEQSRKAIR